MLADDVGVHAAWIYAQVLAQQITEAGCIQDGAGADHPLGREARYLPGHVAQHVHRIGGDEQDAGGVVCGDARDDVLENRRVALHQVEPRLPRSLGCSGGHDHHVGPGAIGIVAGPDARRMGERHGVVQVHRLALGALVVNVNQHDFPHQAVEQQRVGKGRADLAGAYHGDLAGMGRVLS